MPLELVWILSVWPSEQQSNTMHFKCNDCSGGRVRLQQRRRMWRRSRKIYFGSHTCVCEFPPQCTRSVLRQFQRLQSNPCICHFRRRKKSSSCANRSNCVPHKQLQEILSPSPPVYHHRVQSPSLPAQDGERMRDQQLDRISNFHFANPRDTCTLFYPSAIARRQRTRTHF